MSLFILLALFSVCRWLAGYPLQCSYTLKAKLPGADLLPRISSASVYALLDMLAIAGYWMMCGKPLNLVLLLEAGAIAIGARFLFDWAKMNWFGMFKVCSECEFVKVHEDYKSSDPAVVAAAQSKSNSSKYFWWVNGGFGCIYAIIDIAIVYLVK